MENRKQNLTDINGMDLRDFNLDQQHVKEIINLVKEKNGWKMRDPSKEVLDSIQSYNSVNALILPSNDRCLLHMDNNLLMYSITGDTLGTLMEKWNFDYSFKIYKTNYPLVYFQIDTTNHKTYVLEFTDRVMTAINDVGNLDVSTELILNEFDVNSGDYTWGGIARHDTYTSNNCTYINGVDTYTINYDTVNQGQAGEWNTMSLILQKHEPTRSQRYILITGYGADTYAYIFGWNEYTPHKWTTKVKSSSNNVFKIDGTGAFNTKARFMDVLDNTAISSLVTWTNKLSVEIKANYIGYVSSQGLIYYSLYNGGTSNLYSYNILTKDITLLYDSAAFEISSIVYVSDTEIWIGYYRGGTGTVGDHSLVGGGGSSYVFVLDVIGDDVYFCGSSTVVKYNKITKASTDLVFPGGGIAALTDRPGSHFHYVDSAHIYATGTTNALYMYNGLTWSAIGTLAFHAKDLVYVSPSEIYVSANNQVYLWNGSTWATVGTLTVTNLVKIKYFASNNIQATSDNEGIYSWNGTSWNLIAPSKDGALFYYDSNYGNKWYTTLNDNGSGTTITGTNILELDFNINSSAVNFNVYIPNDNDVAKLTYNGSTLAYTPNVIVNIGTSCNAIKSIDGVIGLDTYKYLVTSVDTNVKAYLVSTTNVAKETGTASTFLLGSGSLAVDPFTYTFLNGMHLMQNRYYELQNSNQVGYSLITAYTESNQTKLDVVDLVVGGSTNTLTMLRQSVGGTISNTNPYYLGASYQYKLFGTGIASVFNGGDKHNFYLAYDRRMFQYPITGNKMTDNDVNSIKAFYNAEISGYCDTDGIIMDGVVSYPKGYVTTEINLSKPLPLRPFFLPDSGDSLTNAAVITVYGDAAGTFSNVNSVVIDTRTVSQCQVYIKGASTSNTDNWRLYWKINSAGTSRNVYFYNSSAKTAATQVLSSTFTLAANASAMIVLTNNNNSGFNTSGQLCCCKIYINSTYSDVVSNNQYIVVGNDTSELFNMYEMNDGKNIFRTPISVGNGTTFKTDSDDRSNTFKYWMFYLLGSGLYDDTLPYINIAKGTKDLTNNTYNLAFWKQDSDFKADVWNNLVGSEQFPNRFYNLQVNNYKVGTPAANIYVTNDKIFYRYGYSTRDRFNSTAFWQQNKSVLFEAQDISFASSQLLFMLNYDKKLVNWGIGYKYANLLNVRQLNSNPVAIRELNKNIGFIACENDIYWINGVDENNISISLIANNVGLEKDNFKAIASNGNQVFFYNRKGVWVADSSNQYNGTLTPTNGVLSNVFNLTDPIKDYIYMRDSGNVLIFDMVNGFLYLPLDPSRIPPLKSVMQLNDYGVNSTFIVNNVIAGSSDSGVNFSNYWAVLDYKNLSYRMDAFSDDLDGTDYNNFAGYFKDHPVIRNGTKLIIPEYNQEVGTENPLCRIISKRISFGSLHSQKKLNSFMSAFINNINFELQYFGIDHYKVTFVLDNKYTLEYKYGDYRNASTSYSDVNSAYYSIPTNTDDGWHLQYIPAGIDFNEMVVYIEFARLKDINAPTTAISQVSISEFGFNVINKDVKKKGIQ
ncbi:MAG: hypothetical protein HGB12_00225 [Bacteroidetes bacterium]|nr:hypothetical protein [Bacteroidota bacterium]